MFVIGDVNVVRGEPPEGNPYKASGSGQKVLYAERAYALWLFYHKRDTGVYTLWYSPCCGGARRITAEDVNWATSGVPKMKGDFRLTGDQVVCVRCKAQVYAKLYEETGYNLDSLCKCGSR